jgi:hypothetical protein
VVGKGGSTLTGWLTNPSPSPTGSGCSSTFAVDECWLLAVAGSHKDVLSACWKQEPT